MPNKEKKNKKGHPYYYAVQSSRVDGKPRIVWQKYLGTIEAIVQCTEQSKPPIPKESVIFETSGVAALLRITQKLGVVSPQRNGRISRGCKNEIIDFMAGRIKKYFFTAL